MYSSKININDVKYQGILDFWVLRKVQDDLSDIGLEYKIHELFEGLSDIKNIKMEIIMSILLFSVVRYSNVECEEIEEKFIKDKFDIDKFNKLFDYINNLIKKCMPLNQSNEDDLFEEYIDEDIEKEKEDWDFPFMEYLWYSVLKRTDDFYSVTPKTFFAQMDIYKKMNNVKEDNVKYL